MLNSGTLIPNDFDWKEYSLVNNLYKLLNSDEKFLYKEKDKLKDLNETVDPDNKIPFAPEFDDLARLHYITLNRKVTTILEFGVGKSSIIFSDALRTNKEKWFSYTSKNLRISNLYECHSVDNNDQWINECKSKTPSELVMNNFLLFHKAELDTSNFNGKVCTFFDPIPNVSPDLIYLDAPDQFSPRGDIKGISTRHSDRMPMSGDILLFEHFLQPGTLIIVDGRTANARFLKSNLQRDWAYYYSKDWDQHFFELQEDPLGVYNRRQIEHCLGVGFFERINK